MRAGSDDDAIVDINVTPLVDVSLVLLIIFLATSYLIAQQSLKVKLPKEGHTTATEARTIAVVVKQDGEIVLDGHAEPKSDLAKDLAARHAERPNLQVVVAADRDTRHGDVVDVMDAAKAAGIENMAIATER